MAPWRRRTPLVLSIHGREVLNTPHYLAGLMRRMLRNADLAVAVSKPTLIAAKSVLGGKSESGKWFSSHNGLSYEHEAPAFVRPSRSTSILRIYTFCRLVERKNIHGALHALKLLRDRGIESFEYIISGNGPAAPGLRNLIGDLSLSDKVTMTGYIDTNDIPVSYQTADIFLHPQTAPGDGRDIEGFGIVIADAMSFGALAVVGKAGGPSDFVENERTGLVVNGEDIAAIADALASVLTDTKRLDKMAEEGRKWSLSHLSWKLHVDDILVNLREIGVNA